MLSSLLLYCSRGCGCQCCGVVERFPAIAKLVDSMEHLA